MARSRPPLLEQFFRSIRNREGESLGVALDDALKTVSAEERTEIEHQINALFSEELERPPTIAIIGKTGVGKSLTINALFGTNLPVGHVRATTQEAHELTVDGTLLKGAAGTLVVYDMPGLGEDIDADKHHEATYAKVISECDVAIWIIAATDRTLRVDQEMLRDVVRPANEQVLDRLVVGLNQVDRVQPGEWDEYGNCPSEKQRESIREKVEDIQTKLLKVVPALSPNRIVPYSALRRYHLPSLFAALMDACRQERAWVLSSRKALASYFELMHPQIRQIAEAQSRRREA